MNSYAVYNQMMVKFMEDFSNGACLERIRTSQNYPYLVYTHLHHKTIFDLGKRMGIKADEMFADHDVDKLILYMYLPIKEAHGLHVSLAPHHDKTSTDPVVLLESILDWESARFTKPDKPLNAYETLLKYYPRLEPRMLPIFKQYGLDRPTDYSEVISQERYDQMASKVTPEDILNDILQVLRLT